MAKYRKKPIIIDAVQFDPNILPWPEGVVSHDPCNEINRKGAIETLEGWMTVSPGDYVITGICGERYSCKPDIFRITYEKI